MTTKTSTYILPDQFLTDIFEKPVYQLNVTQELIDGADADLLTEIQNQRCFIQARVAFDDTEAMRFLAEKKFALVDTNVLLEKAVEQSEFMSDIEVRFALPEDEEQTVEVAEKSFRYSRFHADPQISDDKANQLKAQWTRNYFKGERGTDMVVAVADGKICGFNQLINDKKGTLLIDLIAVDVQQRQKGVAKAMISFAENNCEAQRIIVGTQLANAPSLKLYENCGFRVLKTSYVFHYHGAQS